MKIRNKIREYMAAFLYGRGLMRFNQKRFEQAAHIFEKICRLDPYQERKGLTYSYLGRSLIRIGRRNEALQIMSEAYELFSLRIQDFKNEFERKEFADFIRDYIEALNEAGQIERVKEIERTIKG
jgi:tetratricopeptide (TPR) repeat protein